jgi:uncharacterized membrane protein
MSVYASEPTRQEGYSTSAEIGAGLAIFFVPLISLIVALLLMGGQRNERKRGQLRTWAWISVGWIVLQVLFVLLFLVGWSESGGSEGGVITVP